MNPQLFDWSTIWAENLRLIMPEVWLVLGMCGVIMVPLMRRGGGMVAGTAIGALLLALAAALPTIGENRLVFSGMMAIDPFGQFFKILLIVFTLLVVWQWLLTGSRESMPDFLCLLLGAVVGMALMASAANLLMVLIAMESASLPSFALVGFRKRNRLSAEASIKFVLFGVAASAVMIYGMSLIYASVGSLAISDVAGAAQDTGPVLALGLMALFVGFAFKLSAVPLHFWCPDVFEGAPIEVTTFLSVASKGAAVCLMLRVLALLGVPAAEAESSLTMIAVVVAVIGAITATWGNLVALHQTNIKRLLAYSSIAHAGYMIMTVAVISRASPNRVTGAILFYLLVYLFMNLGAFTVAALITQRCGTEDIRRYAGLIRRSPALAVLMILFLLSLFGMPGLGGFMAKIYLMTAMAQAGPAAYALIAVLLINTLISLYYYLRPVHFMVFVEPERDEQIIAPRGAAIVLLGLCAAMLLFTGIYSRPIGKLVSDSSTMFMPRQVSSADHKTITTNEVDTATFVSVID